MLKEETKNSIIIFKPEEGFLRVTTKPDSHIELADAIYDFEVGVKMVNGKPTPVLADTRNFSEHSEEVKAFYANKDRAKNISAMAILIDSLPTRLVGNFFIKINKPHFPTKLFTAEVEAIKWINKIIAENKKEISITI
jgi:hypothetical protein